MAIRSSDTPAASPAEFDSELKQREEAKRERLADPLMRWQALMDAIAWIEQRLAVSGNSREECLRRQARLLSGFAADRHPGVIGSTLSPPTTPRGDVSHDIDP